MWRAGAQQATGWRLDSLDSTAGLDDDDDDDDGGDDGGNECQLIEGSGLIGERRTRQDAASGGEGERERGKEERKYVCRVLSTP